jgi:hypothetical protein
MKQALLLPLLLTGLGAFAQEAAWVNDARSVAAMVPPKLLQVLNDEIAKGGPESAVEACKEKAPQMAKAASDQSGWAIRRVSLLNRNPKAVPDAWERAALEDFDRRAAAGESPTTLEKGEIVAAGERREYRYMKALPVQQVCLACHGPADKIKPEVTSKLLSHYPADKGTGYSIGQIRGAITIRRLATTVPNS